MLERMIKAKCDICGKTLFESKDPLSENELRDLLGGYKITPPIYVGGEVRIYHDIYVCRECLFKLTNLKAAATPDGLVGQVISIVHPNNFDEK